MRRFALWLCLAATLAMSTVAGAQIFQRQRSRIVQRQTCYGENCVPQATVMTSQPVISYTTRPAVVAVAPTPVSYQLEASPIETSTNGLQSAVVQAAVKSQKAGVIPRRDLMKLRVAMFSPAFRAHVEDLALVQVSASGEDMPFTVSADGTIDRTSIDWANLGAFLEKLVPLIIMLLKAFGV